MDTTMTKTSMGLNFAQIAWVVKDIKTAKSFFQDVMGISNFSKVETIRAKEFEGTYYGKPSDAESLVAMAYSGGHLLNSFSLFQETVYFRIILIKILREVFNTLHIAYLLPSLIK